MRLVLWTTEFSMRIVESFMCKQPCLFEVFKEMLIDTSTILLIVVNRGILLCDDVERKLTEWHWWRSRAHRFSFQNLRQRFACIPRSLLCWFCICQICQRYEPCMKHDVESLYFSYRLWDVFDWKVLVLRWQLTCPLEASWCYAEAV